MHPELLGHRVQDASARDALGTFTSGQGDVLLAYENEAIAAQDAGEDIDYVVPDSTILIETPFARPPRRGEPEAAQAFFDYMFSDEGQQLFAERGYRPVDPIRRGAVRGQVPEPNDLFTIDDLGGWDKVTDEFFDTGERFGRRDRGEPGGCDGVSQGAVATAKAPAEAGPSRLGLGGPGLTRGLVVTYLSLMVLLPLAAVVSKSFDGRARHVLERDHRARSRSRR